MGPSNISLLSSRVIFHFHDYGRKGKQQQQQQPEHGPLEEKVKISFEKEFCRPPEFERKERLQRKQQQQQQQQQQRSQQPQQHG